MSESTGRNERLFCASDWVSFAFSGRARGGRVVSADADGGKAGAVKLDDQSGEKKE
jgi:hypothetical protein